MAKSKTFKRPDTDGAELIASTDAVELWRWPTTREWIDYTAIRTNGPSYLFVSNGEEVQWSGWGDRSRWNADDAESCAFVSAALGLKDIRLLIDPSSIRGEREQRDRDLANAAIDTYNRTTEWTRDMAEMTPAKWDVMQDQFAQALAGQFVDILRAGGAWQSTINRTAAPLTVYAASFVRKMMEGMVKQAVSEQRAVNREHDRQEARDDRQAERAERAALRAEKALRKAKKEATA